MICVRQFPSGMVNGGVFVLFLVIVGWKFVDLNILFIGMCLTSPYEIMKEFLKVFKFIGRFALFFECALSVASIIFRR